MLAGLFAFCAVYGYVVQAVTVVIFEIEIDKVFHRSSACGRYGEYSGCQDGYSHLSCLVCVNVVSFLSI